MPERETTYLIRGNAVPAWPGAPADPLESDEALAGSQAYYSRLWEEYADGGNTDENH